MSGRVARKIWSSLDDLVQCCEAIGESRKSCEICPVSANCIREVSIKDFFEEGSFTDIDEFIDTADEITSYPPSTLEEWEAQQADVRRNDPDDWD